MGPALSSLTILCNTPLHFIPSFTLLRVCYLPYYWRYLSLLCLGMDCHDERVDHHPFLGVQYVQYVQRRIDVSCDCEMGM